MKQKRKTKQNKTIQRINATLPQELQAQIITHLADEWRPGRYLGTCALVSKIWLQEARRSFFLDRTVHLYGASGAYWNNKPGEILRDLLYQNEPICTFWPYIRDMHVCGYLSYDQQSEASADYSRLLSLCLSRASSLQSLWIDAMTYSDSLRNTISNLTAIKTITTIRIEDSYFPSPQELDLFLGLFPQLHVKCQLDRMRFNRLEWDHTSSSIFSSTPCWRFLIVLEVHEDLALRIILHHQWTITDLHLDFFYAESTNFNLVSNVLKHIGTPLKSLCLDLHNRRFQGLLPLSLSYNTSLESFHIRGLADFDFRSPDRILHLTWLAPVLNTIESRENFRDFKGVMVCDKDRCDREKVHQWVTGFDWAPVEDAILDLGRFPSEPKLTLALSGGLKWYLKVSVLKDECMPRLAKAGRLMVAEGRDGKGRLVE